MWEMQSGGRQEGACGRCKVNLKNYNKVVFVKNFSFFTVINVSLKSSFFDE